MKITKFWLYLEYQGIFWENIFLKVYKSIYHQKDNFIGFSLFFLFHENILFTSEVITLLVTAYSIDQQIFGHF